MELRNLLLWDLEDLEGNPLRTKGNPERIEGNPEGTDGLSFSNIDWIGWHFISATTATEVSQLINDYGILVAVVYLSEHFDDDQLETIRAAVEECPGVKWLAVLDCDPSQKQMLSNFVADHCFDYHRLPLDLEQLRVSAGHAHGMAILQKAQSQPQSSSTACLELKMVGNSPAFEQIRWLIEKYSQVSEPVLITGESGTGKELIARALHGLTNDTAGPLVAINCGAIPEHLIQSELFGHEKGAFTGAHQRKIGRIESAAGGTLFLDEVGDLPLSLQANLLRFLQEGVIDRVGGSGPIPVKVRVVAATHVNLEDAVAEGKFREDLYYRLNVLRVQVPPLRERVEDIEQLALYFLKKFSIGQVGRIRDFSSRAREMMKIYEWPGNVRELSNKVRRAVVLSEGKFITPEDLGFGDSQIQFTKRSLASVRAEADKSAIVSSLRYSNNNVSAASKILDISRLSLYRLMEKYNLVLER